MARRRGRVTGGAAVISGAALALTLVAPIALAADRTVDIVGFSFSPASVTVSVGDTVTWTNADAQGHTATADGGAFDTGTIARNESQAVTLTTAGTFAYHCTIHPAMTATLVVTAAAAPPATDTSPVSPDPTGRGSSPAGSRGTIGWLLLASLAGLALGARRFGHRATDPSIGDRPGAARGRHRAPGA